MLRDHLTLIAKAAVERAGIALQGVAADVADAKNPEHGDFTLNYALVAAKGLGKNPREVAEALAKALSEEPDLERVEVAGPGFVNLSVKPAAVAAFVPQILALGPEGLPKSQAEIPKRVNVEFVSVNPNGPITIGSGRGAAFGDTLARVLAASGLEVSREYYINDGVNSEQMRLFAESVRHYVRETSGKESTFPEKGYKGDYVRDVAVEVATIYGAEAAEKDADWYQTVSQDLMIEQQRRDLGLFGVNFETWFSEQSLHNEGKVDAAMEKLRSLGVADEEPYSLEIETQGKDKIEKRNEEPPGALWLRSTRFGDDKDRVLVRADGRPAYIAADVAYMESKLGDRGFDKAIYILGPDHHGYIARLEAVCQALGYDTDKLEVVIFQIVRFMREGKPAPMRKRDGNIYELRDLIEELGAQTAPNASKEEQLRVGSDVTRFFYLMRSHETHMDFDIDLATQQSDENPVFYAQYAHARICSVLARAAEAGLSSEGFDPALLSDPRERALVRKILDLPFETARCAKDYGVHRLATYAVELARSYHHFYDGCRVIQTDQPELTRARLALCEAAKVGLRGVFGLIGVSAPERMDREAPEPAKD